MDVRCEKCQTEYELDESKITEAGVTVKCTACGNLFKIRRRAGTAPPVAQTLPDSSDDKLWLIRSPDGDVRRFKELTTLQQWIVERKVTRECEISRTGETWKRLGDIAELASFFVVVEQAQAAHSSRADQRKLTQPMGANIVRPNTSSSPPRAVTINPNVTAQSSPPGDPTRKVPAIVDTPPPRAGGRERTPPPTTPPPATPATPAARTVQMSPISSQSLPKPPPRAPTAPPANVSDGPSRGGRFAAPDDDGQSGPTGGFAERSADPAWSRKSRIHQAAYAEEDEQDDYRPPRSKLPWIILGILVAGGGAAAAAVLIMNKNKHGAGPTGPVVSAPASSAVSSALAVASGPPDAGVVKPAPVDPLIDGLKHLYADTDEDFIAAEKILDGGRVADAAKDAQVLAAEAMVHATWAQYLNDDADRETDKHQAEELRAESKRKLSRADKESADAQGRVAKAPEVLVAIAAVRLQQGKKPADVEKMIAGIDSPEALFVRGMARWHANKLDEAATLLGQAIDAQAKANLPDFRRARYFLGELRLDQKKPDEAAALLVAAGTPRAQALARKAAPAGAPDAGPTVAVASSTPRGTPSTTAAPAPSGDYEQLVAAADKDAENGHCDRALPEYERALGVRPGGIEANTGSAYCYMDKNDYSTAESRFRLALDLSSRYEDALIGMAECYQFQGQKDQAASYYKKYLDAWPSGSKAAMAKHALEQLAPAQPQTTISEAPVAPVATSAPAPPSPPPPTPPPPTEDTTSSGATP